MKQETSYLKIGIFVLFVLVLLILGLIAFSSEFWGGSMILFETYLDESVQGLDVGSAVLQRGVKIGRVKEITFVPRVYTEIEPGEPGYDKYSRYVMVIMEIEQKHFPSYEEDPQLFQIMIRQQINSGLRIKLAYQGITGIASLELNYVDPKTNPPLEIAWKPKHIYIPSAPSLITSFTSAVENIFRRLENIDFEGSVDQIRDTMAELQAAVKDAEFGKLSETMMELMKGINETTQQLQSSLRAVTDPNVPGSVQEGVLRFTETLETIQSLISEHEYDIDEIIKNLKELSEGLRELADRLNADPAQLLFSSPPPKSEVFNENGQ